MKFETTASSFVCACRAYTGFSYVPDLDQTCTLRFYARVVPETPGDNVFLSVAARKFINGLAIAGGSWQTQEEISEFQEVELSLSDCDFDSLAIIVQGGGVAAATDQCIHRSICWVDHFSLETTVISSARDPLSTTDFAYPNPSNGIVHLAGDLSKYTRYEVYSVHGAALQTGPVSNFPLELQHKGVLVLVLYTNDQGRMISRIINK